MRKNGVTDLSLSLSDREASLGLKHRNRKEYRVPLSFLYSMKSMRKDCDLPLPVPVSAPGPPLTAPAPAPPSLPLYLVLQISPVVPLALDGTPV
jgi:hypothetical protein